MAPAICHSLALSCQRFGLKGLPTTPIIVPDLSKVTTRQLAGSRNLPNGVFADAAGVVALLVVAVGFGAEEVSRALRVSSPPAGFSAIATSNAARAIASERQMASVS